MKKFLLIVFAFCLLFSCSKDDDFTPSENLENGDFSNEMQNWAVKTENGASANGLVSDGALTVQISNNGSNIWDARLSYTRGLFLKKGTTYRIGFSAWSDVSKQIYPDITGDKNGFKHYYQPGTFNLSNKPVDFFFAFTMNYADDEKCALEFDLAGDKSTSHFDNITIAKLNPPALDMNGEWTYTIYKPSGEEQFKYSAKVIMSPEGLIQTENDMWTKGYLSGNELEIDFHGALLLKGTINDKTITGTYKNFENGVTGNFKAVPKANDVAEISGTYDLSASYTTLVVSINNETDVFGISQSGTTISIPAKTGVTGSISGNSITLSGDILPGAASGGNQVFFGTISGNSISGIISGTVKVLDINNNITLQSITNGTFTMVKRQ